MRITLSSLLLLLVAFLPLAGQHNPYEIDDDCYLYYEQAEALLSSSDSAGFDQSVESLRETALEKGDDKALTLYYVLMLRRTSHVSRLGFRDDPGKANEAVESARLELQRVAREKGYIQYYYYAYDLAQTYYFNTKQSGAALALLDEMYEIAKGERDDYGQWQAVRFISRLHQDREDVLNARKYLMQGLDIYEKSSDPVLRRQSVTRMYCDLADTYDIAEDSARIFYNQAFLSSKVHLDTLRCVYYQAQVAAFDGKKDEYVRDRDYCLDDPSFKTLFKTGAEMFGCVDAIVKGDRPSEALLDTLSLPKQQRFVGRLAAENGMYDIAYKMMLKRFTLVQRQLANVNVLRLDEYSGKYNHFSLSRQLQQKGQEASRMSRLAAILLSILLFGALAISLLHIRRLRRDQERDEARIEELRAANEKVRLADAAKTRFVQNMSHEVRTPLNAIVGFSQLLALPDGSFPPEEKDEFAGHIVNNTKMLTMLLDDILNASAMDSGNYRISYEEGEVHFICRAAISSSEHRLQPGVQMVYEPESEIPFFFQTDPRRVQQILINLLTNACKHTPSGVIKLTSSVREHQGRVTFAVTDTGPGIPPEQAEVIFERFTKLNEFVQGTGLGLSICRDIAGRMGAKVYLDTTYNKGGARFVFEVPVVPPTENMK